MIRAIEQKTYCAGLKASDIKLIFKTKKEGRLEEGKSSISNED